MTPKSLLFLLVCALNVHICMAQPDEVLASINFRTFGLTHGITTDLYYRSDDRYEKLPLNYFRPSSGKTATLAEDGSLPLFTKGTTAENEIQYSLHSRVSVPGEGRQILILGAQTGNRLVLNAVRDNLSGNHKDWLFINISQIPVGIQLGEEKSPIRVSPGTSVFHSVQVEAGKGAAIQVAAYKENGWERIYSRFWPIYKEQRCMVVFMEVEGDIQVFNFFEAIKTKAPEETED